MEPEPKKSTWRKWGLRLFLAGAVLFFVPIIIAQGMMAHRQGLLTQCERQAQSRALHDADFRAACQKKIGFADAAFNLDTCVSEAIGECMKQNGLHLFVNDNCDISPSDAHNVRCWTNLDKLP